MNTETTMKSEKVKTMTQSFEQQRATVVIVKNGQGNRAARISFYGPMTRKGVQFVPLEILELAAGKDAWMREIQFACRNCRVMHPAKDMQSEYCPDCVAEQERQNAILDGQDAN